MATYMIEAHVPEVLRGFVAALAEAGANVADGDIGYALNCETVPLLIQADSPEDLDRKLASLGEKLGALGVPNPIFGESQEIG